MPYNMPSFFKPLGKLEHFNKTQLKATEELIVQMDRIHSRKHPGLVGMLKDVQSHLHEAQHLIEEARSLERLIRTGKE